MIRISFLLFSTILLGYWLNGTRHGEGEFNSYFNEDNTTTSTEDANEIVRYSGSWVERQHLKMVRIFSFIFIFTETRHC